MKPMKSSAEDFKDLHINWPVNLEGMGLRKPLFVAMDFKSRQNTTITTHSRGKSLITNKGTKDQVP